LIKHNHELSEDELKDYPITGIVEGWFFKIDELSHSYYRVIGIDRFGRSVGRDGIDIDLIFSQLRVDIHEMIEKNKEVFL
jgi:hypothetical protein